jgi:hypothetical protein
MIAGDDTNRLKRRLMIAGVLAFLGVALTLADRFVPPGSNAVVNDFAAAHADSKQINAAIDALLGRYLIEPRAMTTWRVTTPDKKFLRLEQRIVVPYGFATVEFNHQLSQEVLPFGARVAATERSRENVVTMHVVKNGVIIRTIAFAMRPYEPGDQGKEARGTAKRKAD